jgi:hypothetical protein
MTEMPTDFFELPEQAYETTVHMSDGTFVKAYKVQHANTGLPQHSHPYSHTSYIATGSVKAWKDGAYLGLFKAPIGILIEAHCLHFFQTLEDNTTVLCIHSLTDGEEPQIEQEHLVVVAGVKRTPRLSHPPLEGFSFQEEDYDDWLTDAQPLFRQHMTQTGQDPDGAMMKNIPLGRQMANMGALMVTTARSNGRMFAYLLSMISPTLDEADVMTAHLMLPFASPEAPGAGKGLHRATIEMLRAKGVRQVYGRAGVRGDGPRLGSMYKRLGFKDDGALYRLDL